MKRILFCLLFFFPLISSFAQSGKLDSSFGKNGIVKTNIGSDISDHTFTFASQVLTANGCIYIIMNYNGTISKRKPGGSIDSSYGVDGFSQSLPLFEVYAALQPDGKMLIAGNFQSNGAFYVGRINAKGKIDSSFGINGMQSTPWMGPDSHATAVAVQADGKIILVGGGYVSDGRAFSVVRFDKNGILDSSFNGNGYATIGFPYVEYDRSGPYYYSAGTPYAVAVQADGKIIVAGEAYGAANFAIARLNQSGTLDSSFDGDGRQTLITNPLGGGYSLAIQKDGKILLAGQGLLAEPTPVARFNVNGSLDSSFNGNGMQSANLSLNNDVRNPLALQTDGKIVIAGNLWDGTTSDFVVVRFNANGTPDNSFGGDGQVTTDIQAPDLHASNDFGGSVAIQANNKILVAGYSLNAPRPLSEHFDVLRYNTNGDLDSTFGANGILDGDTRGSTRFNDIAIQADGKIVAAGRTFNGTDYDFAVVRYNTDGRIDPSFGINGHQITNFGADDEEAISVSIQPDGKIILAGEVLNTAVWPASYYLVVARYNADGTLDTTFSGDGKMNTFPGYAFGFGSLALQADGKIVISGSAVSNFATVRLNTDGTPDNTFSEDGIQLTQFSNSPSFGAAVAIQGDGKIVVAGRSYINNKDNFALVRYNNDGSLDASFSEDGKQNNFFGVDNYFGDHVAIQNDGNIVVGGEAENEDGTHTYVAVARYKPNGLLDSTFNGSGFLSININTWVAIDGNGRIVIGGNNPDSSTGVNVIQISPLESREIATRGLVFSGDKLYAAGNSSEYPNDLGVVARYLLPTGSPLVSSFITTANGNWNEPSTWVGGVVPTPAAQVIVRNNVTITADASCYSLKVESPGKIIINTGAHLMITH